MPTGINTQQQQSLSQFSVLGIPVHLTNNYGDWLKARLLANQGTHVVTLNPEMIMLCEQDPLLAGIIRQADLVVPDGAGVVLYLRWRGQKQQRCPGIELAEDILLQASKLGQSCQVFFYGGAPGVTDSAAQTWHQRASNLNITTSHGYLTPPEEQQLKRNLQAQQPQLILVGLGVPRQELWISQNRHLCPQAIWIGVGGSFDIWSGSKSRAPAWLRGLHLEWLYRLYQEPWRWRRMLVLPQFALRALGETGEVLQ